jgi:hypothetical protein
MAVREQADRHYRSDQVPVGARLDKPDYDGLEAARQIAGLTRRQAIITAIREWVAKHAPETDTPGGNQ